MNTTHRTSILAAALLTVVVSGCSSRYQVTDPASDKTYYTKDIDRERQGTVRFKDARTGADVTLTSSEVKKISRSDYDAAVGKK